MKKNITISGRKIGLDQPPFIIAEMSGNHNRSLDRAKDIVEQAAKAGAHAIKLQTYTPDTMTLDLDKDEFVIADPDSLWKTKSLYKLYQEAYTPWEWHKAIFQHAEKHGLIAFSSPFDDTAVDFLEELEVPCYKIASFENTDLQLIKKVASTGKPMIMATGMATLAELDQSINVARSAGCGQIILLKCTSSYPASPEDANIRTIENMRETFSCETGISDHTMGIGVSIAAVAMGATVIERHFTLQRADGGVDADFSLEPDEFAALAQEADRAWRSLGRISYGPSGSEKSSLTYRRSLYIVNEMKEGDVLTKENVRAIRPGKGLPTKYFDLVIGKRIKKSVRKGTPLQWDILL